MAGKEVFSGQFGERLLFVVSSQTTRCRRTAECGAVNTDMPKQVAVFPTPSSGVGVVT